VPTNEVVAAPTTSATPGRTPLIVVLDATATPSAAPANTSEPASTPSHTPLPTVEPTLAAEVGQAYENFWQVTSQALLELDTTHLEEVTDGDYLASISDRIVELRAEGKAIKTHVILDYSVLAVSQSLATIVDDFEDDSVYVRVGTEDPISEPTGDQIRTVYTMSKSSGVWKVVDSVRSQ
jgi:hypothetical protein